MPPDANNMKGRKKRAENGDGAGGHDAGGAARTTAEQAPAGAVRTTAEQPLDGAAGTTAGSLDGRTWLRYSISIWDDLAKSREERGFKHPAMFPSSLTDRLLEIFAPRDGGLVIDPFMGSGSTVCSAYRKGLPAIGFELSPEYIAIAERRLEDIREALGPRPLLIKDSSTRLLQYVAAGSAGLCITSPPYWDVLQQRRTADGKQIRHYGDDSQDLGRIGGYEEFLAALQDIFVMVYQALRPLAYCIAVVMDVRKKDRLYPLHMDLSRRLTAAGFTLDDIIIWDRRQEYNNLRPLGYPHVFRVNKVHEYILIFQKR
jgi:DNA modification methylase